MLKKNLIAVAIIILALVFTTDAFGQSGNKNKPRKGKSRKASVTQSASVAPTSPTNSRRGPRQDVSGCACGA